MGDIHIGPAGWAYKDWNGIVYPQPRPRGFSPLRYLADYFDTIEINSTFYGPPTPQTARRWVEDVSHNPRFLYTAKLWREFTHAQALTAANERALRPAMETLLASGKLGALLFWRFDTLPGTN
jgi:uncharacterized protein YecE (DUF72 family)